MNEDRVRDVEEMRRVMGTAPSAHPPLVTEFHRGVEGIDVRIVPGSFPTNPYRAIFEMAVSTWGSSRDVEERWPRTPPHARAMVVRAVLSGNALPLALEAPSFTFRVLGASRWAFDQIARARLGIVFSSMGTRDNRHDDIGFRFHESTWANPRRLEEAKRACLAAKASYVSILEEGRGSWQEAREVLPISSVHRFSFAANYAALRMLVGSRARACEAEDDVAVAILVRREVGERFPLLGAWLRPGCDFARRCTYHAAYSASEMFGALFRPCGRWPAAEYTLGEDFQRNESCSDYPTICAQIGCRLPGGLEERPEDYDPMMNERDAALFSEDWAG